ncbi:MAG: GH92 family glycosyl hydrolase [Tannerella sp.]|jgi:predicted alpha-1,2-mannosidase|nr:GH92 family glycosyl hydrolase [Tannerella sp.]
MKLSTLNGINLWLCASLLVALNACKHAGTEEAAASKNNLTQYVDPRIGTGDHGHVFVGANVPFGFVQLGPTNFSKGWDWCSGYHVSDSTIIGFGHTHLSGTGIGDLGDIGFMPAAGEVKLTLGTLDNPESGIYSLFRHETETVRPGYYAVRLDRFGIDVELTATKRVGFHKYTFPASADARVIIDLEHGIGWDSTVEGFVTQENDTVVSGYRYSRGWADDQRIYFTAVFSKPVRDFKFETVTTERRVAPYGQVFFDTNGTGTETIFAKVALSPVSIDNAKLNMQTELPGWDFEQTVARADCAWNEELNKIDFRTADERTKRIFYTALYHTMIAPSEFCDVNNDYPGADKTVHRAAPFTNYTTFSLWDTYRAAHPLMTLIHPEKMPDIIRTMLAIFREQGKLPVWHLMANETDCMVGNPGIPVVADAVLKGFGGFDPEEAFEAMKRSAMLDERGQKWMREYGYIPFDRENQSIAKTMEYAIADWSVAQVANTMGRTEDYQYFKQLSEGYKHYFDPELQFVRGKDSQGKFREPFDPFRSAHGESDYTEGTAWQYTWLVPHDVEGLVNLFGSKEAFLQKFDSLFIVAGDMGDEASPDISGLIGQYAHGNEPSHHVLYLYACVGEPDKTAEKVRYVLENLYTDQPAGLCGNEDVGQMSAWYVLSALGLYQVEPAGGRYVFGSPVMDEARIRTGNGKTFTIVARNNSPAHKYIRSVTLNGQPYHKHYIEYKDMAAGGTLEFEMSGEAR